jgi:hypothetical protein
MQSRKFGSLTLTAATRSVSAEDVPKQKRDLFKLAHSRRSRPHVDSAAESDCRSRIQLYKTEIVCLFQGCSDKDMAVSTRAQFIEMINVAQRKTYSAGGGTASV